MLDDVTKKRINTLRQILVGKLPDPKAQVEQITNGLIYKFMNDMDEQSVSMGGKSTYFSGKFQKYSWKNLMDAKTSGVEKIKLYSDAIEKMYTNENLPELFREIFKNSFLPFKDPSTLNMFLKEINEFNYSHSEKLGDAFEYLLSFMGSQGDAGQFRTPRHIIDFIVEIVNPQKNETILDPACGTAGFLISSYKHILNQNTKKNLGDGLTASDRKKIGENLNGYDISPDMVKMSLVNMYLHKFTNPKINEYDTLSSEDKWNEYYDVILANPPFFSPKGGITPHNRFGVKSTKAEILFIDFINEHLKPNGRAGIIVPEGIIFQRGNAYKQLRKKLIETSLISVISLPMGVFLPYSNVKTSILILDKNKSKKLNEIFIYKIQSDGFSLDNQRKKIETNDISDLINLFNSFLNEKNSKETSTKNLNKEELLKSEDFSFAESYEEELNEGKYDLTKLLEISDFFRGVTYKKEEEVENNGNKVLRANNIDIDGNLNLKNIKLVSKKVTFKQNQKLKKNDILMCIASGSKDHIGKIAFISEDLDYVFGGFMGVFRAKENFNPRLLWHFLKSSRFRKHLDKNIHGANINNINKKVLENFNLPLPPLEIQNKILDEIDTYQKVIDGCTIISENYFPKIFLKQEFKKVKLGQICKFSGGTQPPKSTFINNLKNGYIRLLQIRDYKSDKFLTFIPKSEKHKTCTEKDIMIGRYGPPVFQILRGKSGAYNVALMKCVPDNKVLTNDWLYFFLKSKEVQRKIISLSTRVRQSGVRPDDLNELMIPLPSIIEQEEMCNEINSESHIIDQNNKLVSNFQVRINQLIENLWNN